MRNPRRSARLLAVALLAGALAPLGAGGAHAPRAAASGTPAHVPCPPPGARLIAGDGVVRVYRAAAPPSTRASTEACLVRRGTRMTLVPAGRGLPGILVLGELAFAGSVVAYVEGRFGVDAGCWGIVVADVARRRVLQRLPAVACSVDAGIARGEAVTDLRVERDGPVAWIVERGTRRSAKTFAVYAARRGRAPSLLDEAPDIGARSLALSAGTVSWWRAGARRSARPAS